MTKRSHQSELLSLRAYRILDPEGNDWGLWSAENPREALDLLSQDMISHPEHYLWSIGEELPDDAIIEAGASGLQGWYAVPIQ